jgi:hypothetical protein
MWAFAAFVRAFDWQRQLQTLSHAPECRTFFSNAAYGRGTAMLLMEEVLAEIVQYLLLL